jgi:uncharacterized protein
MKIHENIEIFGFGLYFEDTLIIGDLHLGLENYLQEQGVFVPRNHYSDILKEIKELVEELRPSRIVINGDLKHNFGGVSKEEWKTVFDLISYLESEFDEIILIRGNHDNFLESMLKNYSIHDYFVLNKVLITHGHKDVCVDFDTIILSHEHPAIELRDGARVEKYKCFLKGKLKDKTVIVIPSFSNITPGINVLIEKPMSPYLTNYNYFEVYVAEANGMYFGPRI